MPSCSQTTRPYRALPYSCTLEPENRIHSKHGLRLPTGVVIGCDPSGEGPLVPKLRTNRDQIGEPVRPPNRPAPERSVKARTLASSVEDKIQRPDSYEVLVRQLERCVVDDSTGMGQSRQKCASPYVGKEGPRWT